MCESETREASTNSSLPGHDKPLMQLFERLIGNDNKQNTVLTNAQIVDILNNEFDIDIMDLHELEVEIYLNIIKRFLKDWPQWDEFDRIMKELKEQGNNKMLRQLLITKYTSLKKYLKLMLETCKPMAKETVSNVVEKTAGKVNKPQIDTSDIVMEVQCSRTQLNQLFFCKPNPNYKNTIFNIAENAPSARIIVNSLPLESMLNWWNVTMTVNLKGFVYTRELVHKLKHVLVNKKLAPEDNESNVLDQDLEVKVQKKLSKVCKIQILKLISSYLENIKNAIPSGLLETYTIVLGIINKDMDYLPDELDIPGVYRRYASKYKYRRYLYKDVENFETDSNKYDLQLEETLSPMYKYNIIKFDSTVMKSSLNEKILFNFECGLCSEKFEGLQPVDLLKDHFMSHQLEPDWHCTNCKTNLSMSLLASQNWMHECPS